MSEPAALNIGMGFGCPIGLLTMLVVYRRLAWRPKPGHCTKCNYDLTSNISSRSPECGEPTSSDGSGET